MKKCPFCAEEIQDQAIKCRFCNEFLDDSYKPAPKKKWYYSTTAIVIGIVTLGPLALPLVWKNPKYSLITKTTITIVLVIFTIWLCYLVGGMYQRLIQQINSMGMG